MNPRISAVRGQYVSLDVDFYEGGVLTDPYAVRKIEIYKDQVLPHNLVIEIPVLEPTDDLYPAPLQRLATGKYRYDWLVPPDVETPAAYIDLWYFYSTNPCDTDGTGTGTDWSACDLDDYVAYLISVCNRFWVYPDNWVADDGLQSIRFGFEPLTQKFNKGDIRYLEVGLMPLPLYDFDYNKVMPLIPRITATIDIQTRNCEAIVTSESMNIGLRQGSYRTNPFVLRWMLDASRFLIGTYRYRIKLQMPNGTVQASEWMIITVS
jgi:hypothetical protein